MLLFNLVFLLTRSLTKQGDVSPQFCCLYSWILQYKISEVKISPEIVIIYIDYLQCSQAWLPACVHSVQFSLHGSLLDWSAGTYVTFDRYLNLADGWPN